MGMKKLSRSLAALLCAAIVVPSYCAGSVRAAGDVAINEVNFPDPNFRSYVQSAFDTDYNGYLSASEITKIRNVHCESLNIYSLKGIEFFSDLSGLWCKNNHISELDLSGNPNINGVWCSGNDFTSLDFSNAPSLTWVYCFECKLQSINFTNNPKMAYIECNLNPNLKNLDVTGNPLLEHLFASDCGLTSIDVSNNPYLCELNVFDNDLRSINVSNNPYLKRLDIWNNKNLGNVDISSLKGLEYFNCAKTGLTKLDVTHNPQLMNLICSYNGGLKSLDLSNNPRLEYLNVELDTSLRKLDLSHNPKLYHLYAFGMSSINSIDISNNYRLCVTYNDGVYADESHLGDVYSKTIDYGGTNEIFNNLIYEICLDKGTRINASFNGNDAPDVYVNPNDGYTGSEQFATRGQAVQALYERAGSPATDGSSRFTDIAGSPYANAIMWAEDHNICFGAPDLCSDTFHPDELITRQDFALMAHRFAKLCDQGTAYDYGRTDWYADFYDIDYYCWGAFTWAMQFSVLERKGDHCYPHGRMTLNDLNRGVAGIFTLDEAASYAKRTDGTPYTPPVNNQPVNTSTPTPTPRPNNNTKKHNVTDDQILSFVERIYRFVLDREPEAEGSAYWSDELYSFRRTGAEVAQGFIFSPEFESRNTSNTQFVNILYKTFFGRDPEEGGMKFWTGKLASGEMDRFTVANGFIYSQEWADTCASYGIRSGGDLKPSGAIAPSELTYAFVERLYITAMGRGYDEDGRQYWASELANFNISGEQAGASFFFSAEFVGFNLSDMDFLGRLYVTFMNREADAEGEAYWIGILKSGVSREDVVYGFTRSPEFTEKCIEARIYPY